MVMTDPIADLLTRIRNAMQMKHETVQIPSSNVKLEILRVLKEEGYVNDFVKTEDNLQGIITVSLKYVDKVKAIRGLKRISKPGLRVYAKKDELPRVFNGLGIAIISTSCGIMTDRDARKQNLGGEVLAFVW